MGLGFSSGAARIVSRRVPVVIFLGVRQQPVAASSLVKTKLVNFGCECQREKVRCSSSTMSSSGDIHWCDRWQGDMTVVSLNLGAFRSPNLHNDGEIQLNLKFGITQQLTTRSMLGGNCAKLTAPAHHCRGTRTNTTFFGRKMNGVGAVRNDHTYFFADDERLRQSGCGPNSVLLLAIYRPPFPFDTAVSGIVAIVFPSAWCSSDVQGKLFFTSFLYCSRSFCKNTCLLWSRPHASCFFFRCMPTCPFDKMQN